MQALLSWNGKIWSLRRGLNLVGSSDLCEVRLPAESFPPEAGALIVERNTCWCVSIDEISPLHPLDSEIQVNKIRFGPAPSADGAFRLPVIKLRCGTEILFLAHCLQELEATEAGGSPRTLERMLTFSRMLTGGRVCADDGSIADFERFRSALLACAGLATGADLVRAIDDEREDVGTSDPGSPCCKGKARPGGKYGKPRSSAPRVSSNQDHEYVYTFESARGYWPAVRFRLRPGRTTPSRWTNVAIFSYFSSTLDEALDILSANQSSPSATRPVIVAQLPQGRVEMQSFGFLGADLLKRPKGKGRSSSRAHNALALLVAGKDDTVSVVSLGRLGNLSYRGHPFRRMDGLRCLDEFYFLHRPVVVTLKRQPSREWEQDFSEAALRFLARREIPLMQAFKLGLFMDRLHHRQDRLHALVQTAASCLFASGCLAADCSGTEPRWLACVLKKSGDEYVFPDYEGGLCARRILSFIARRPGLHMFDDVLADDGIFPGLFRIRDGTIPCIGPATAFTYGSRLVLMLWRKPGGRVFLREDGPMAEMFARQLCTAVRSRDKPDCPPLDRPSAPEAEGDVEHGGPPEAAAGPGPPGNDRHGNRSTQSPPGQVGGTAPGGTDHTVHGSDEKAAEGTVLCTGKLFFPLGELVEIGRTPLLSPGLRIELDLSVSKRHALLVRSCKTGAWHVYDIRSRNGIEVEGDWVDARRVLRGPASIAIGGLSLLFSPYGTRDASRSGNSADACEQSRPLRNSPARRECYRIEADRPLSWTFFEIFFRFASAIAAGTASERIRRDPLAIHRLASDTLANLAETKALLFASGVVRADSCTMLSGLELPFSNLAGQMPDCDRACLNSRGKRWEIFVLPRHALYGDGSPGSGPGRDMLVAALSPMGDDEGSGASRPLGGDTMLPDCVESLRLALLGVEEDQEPQDACIVWKRGRRVIDGPVLIGRHLTCEIMLSDELVSRVHCLILPLVSEDRLLVIDMLSSNGTFVDGKRVELARLSDGARLQMGNEKFTIRTARYDPERRRRDMDLHRCLMRLRGFAPSAPAPGGGAGALARALSERIERWYSIVDVLLYSRGDDADEPVLLRPGDKEVVVHWIGPKSPVAFRSGPGLSRSIRCDGRSRDGTDQVRTVPVERTEARSVDLPPSLGTELTGLAEMSIRTGRTMSTNLAGEASCRSAPPVPGSGENGVRERSVLAIPLQGTITCVTGASGETGGGAPCPGIPSRTARSRADRSGPRKAGSERPGDGSLCLLLTSTLPAAEAFPRSLHGFFEWYGRLLTGLSSSD